VDSGFVSDQIVTMLDELELDFTVSVPFERFPELKRMIEQWKCWKKMDETWSYFEMSWKPKCWDQKYRFLRIRQRCKEIFKGPILLDFFIPGEYGFAFKVIVTNKSCGMRKLMRFHHSRGSQGREFSELKSQVQMNYIPVRKLYGNQLYLMVTVLAHILTKELQIIAASPSRGTTE